MTPMPPAPSSPASLNRRGFVASVGSGASGVLIASRVTTAAVGNGPASGRKATIQVALIGCGGRGTGAAVQAVRASSDVRIFCLADLFPDHLAESAAILERAAGVQFACPSRRRFFGPDAWQRAIESDVDLVILATHPAARPAQFAAAVRAGRHVYCEPPAAVDLAGSQLAAAALAEARQRGLAVVAGLPSRHDDLLASLILRLRDARSQTAASHHDGIGRPLRVAIGHLLGVPWFRPVLSASRFPEHDLVRNWITAERLSGGPLVERLVYAIDRALWMFGDECPIAAVPLESAGCPGEFPEHSGGTGAGRVAARFVYADGRGIDAVVERRPRGISYRRELLEGTHGRIDLARHGDPVPSARHPLQVAMDRLIGMIRDTGPQDRTDSAAALVRSTLAAVLGRTAAETGRSVEWPRTGWQTGGLAQSVQGARPIQYGRS